MKQTLLFGMAMLLPLAAGAEDMAPIPGGTFASFYAQSRVPGAARPGKTAIEPFLLDREPVTNRDYLAFVASHSEWRRSAVKRVFADRNYLQHWQDDASVRPEDLDRPVVNVSWFAAAAYCEARGARLPSTDEWEYALNDRGAHKAAIQQMTLDWYATTGHDLPKLGTRPPNGFGVRDMAGVIWEWTDDFNSFIAPSDPRNPDDKNLTCGGGSLNARDAGDYAAFMRYSFRSSMQGGFTERSLGFRCAKDLQ